MKRFLQVSGRYTGLRFSESEWAIELLIVRCDLTSLVVELQMLLSGLSDSLSIRCHDARSISIEIGDSTIHGNEKSKKVVIHMDRTSLGLVQSYLLRWYADGLAQVTHIDIPLCGEESAGKDCTFVLKAENVKPPMSSDDATRILLSDD